VRGSFWQVTFHFKPEDSEKNVRRHGRRIGFVSYPPPFFSSGGGGGGADILV
jgi:hypothetical protein